jgi:ribosomal protein S18 acetylase RimI-like enzyme
MRTRLVTKYLEMTDPAQLRPPRAPDPGLEVRRAALPCPELNRFLYTAVGGDWHWLDRLGWSYQRWLAYLDRPELETWVGHLEGTPAGYFELEERPDTGVEIVYFGLLPGFVGRGVGGHLLARAVTRAWARQPPCVWLHTCSLDHPAALANYLARGFRQYREEVQEKDLPERPPGPWPDAGPRR